MNTALRSRDPRSAAFTPPHRWNAVAVPIPPAPLTLKRHKCRAPNSSRHARSLQDFSTDKPAGWRRLRDVTNLWAMTDL